MRFNIADVVIMGMVGTGVSIVERCALPVHEVVNS